MAIVKLQNEHETIVMIYNFLVTLCVHVCVYKIIKCSPLVNKVKPLNFMKQT